MKLATKDETERAMERVMERVMKRVMEPLLEPMIERLLKQEKKRAKKQAMERATEPMIEQMMEPMIERLLKQVKKRAKKQAMERATESMMKRAMEQMMKPAKKRMMEQMMKPAKKRAKKRATESAMEPNFSTQDATADCIQRTPPDHQISKLDEREFQFDHKLPKIKEAKSEAFAVMDHHDEKSSTGMENDKNHASSSHKIGFTTEEEINLDLALRPPEFMTNDDSGPSSHLPLRNSSILNTRTNLLLSQEAEPYISLTTGPLLQGDLPSLPSLNDPAEVEPPQFPITAHQGSAGMPNANNHASSSHHNSVISPEIVQNVASKPLVMSTGSHVNVQLLCNSDSGSSSHPPLQLYGDLPSLPSLNDPVEVELHNNPATDPQPPQFPITTYHQGSVGMQNANNDASSSHHKSGLSPKNVQPSHVGLQLTLSNDSHAGSSQLNELVWSFSPNTELLIESFLIDNEPHSIFPASQNSQNTVMSPGSSFFN
ncbi:hypothetical protein QYF36_001881 [Acer negundo]|nr:hypothetical protein QYF36_001881 [Acer negundo]